jgi:HSP20 family protein
MAEQTSVPVKAEGQGLRRWDPFEMFNELQEEMARRWAAGWPIAPLVTRRRLFEPAAPWAPSLDVYEKDGNLVVKAELPGIQKEDIDVTLDRGDLVIRGERKAEKEVKEENYYRMERSYGSFQRRLPLPFDVKPEQIQATYTDGVLEIRIPKPPEAQPQPQKIQVA